MKFILLAAFTKFSCSDAFLQAPSTSSLLPSIKKNERYTSRLHGIQEWREQALESKYTLDIYDEKSPNSSGPVIAATVPVLPFPFSDILLQGQRTQLNLYEQRFHELFQDAVENHCGMVGMGLLAGNGMITTLPLCEVESFTRFGAEEDWVDRGDGMGNGSIFVTIRAVGRAKIAEDDLFQEVPYMKARVAELLDEDMDVAGVREDRAGESKLTGEASPLSVASSVAGNIENLLHSLESMEHKFKQIEEQKKDKDDDDEMNRRLVNAQLESLFMKDSTEGVDVENKSNDETTDDDDDGDDDDDDDLEALLEAEGAEDEKLDRFAQFEEAFESAKDADTFGYVLQPTIAVDSLTTESNTTKQSKEMRTPKDLTAISWAAFCTGDKNDIKRDVMKIQALDMTNVLQRLQLGSAMLREEKTKWRAKLALAGVKNLEVDEEES